MNVTAKGSPGRPPQKLGERDIAELYDRFAPMIYRRCLRFFGPQEAEDMMHEVFLHAFQRIDSFRGEAAPSTWLYKVATNLCLKRLTRDSRRQELWQRQQEALVPPTFQNSSQEAAAALQEIWRALPDELVTIGIYYYGDGMSHDEIAAVLGVSRRTIGNRLEELQRRVKKFAAKGDTG